MEDRDWLVLQVLFAQKSITKTAQLLYISQPALTSRLKQIEEEFGVRIVFRGSKGVHFTPQGEYLVQRAGEMLQQIRTIKQQVISIDNEVAGTLRLGASNFVTKYILPRLLSLFKQQYPQVEFNVTTAWSKDVYPLIYNQDIHVGFSRGDYEWRDEKYLLFEESVCIASKHEIDIKQLPDIPRIEYRTDHLAKSMMDNWWRDNFSQPPLISMDVNQVDTCKEMIVNGLGYGIMPRRILRDTTDLFTIDLQDKNGQPLVRRTWMIYQQELLEINVVRAFVDFIKTLDFSKEG
ncbi:MAG: LysR family transcriptional regulator [Negativicutes bacterium]|nr:LysR family transcriptional regulator [Negativicutes bacterium]